MEISNNKTSSKLENEIYVKSHTNRENSFKGTRSKEKGFYYQDRNISDFSGLLILPCIVLCFCLLLLFIGLFSGSFGFWGFLEYFIVGAVPTVGFVFLSQIGGDTFMEKTEKRNK